MKHQTNMYVVSFAYLTCVWMGVLHSMNYVFVRECRYIYRLDVNTQQLIR